MIVPSWRIEYVSSMMSVDMEMEKIPDVVNARSKVVPLFAWSVHSRCFSIRVVE